MEQKLVEAHRELAAAKAELDFMLRTARDAIAQAHAVADTVAEQGRALEEQRQKRAEALTLDLEAAQRAIEGFKAKDILADEARHSMEASLAEANRALDDERHKIEVFEQELTTVRQTSDANKTSANLAAVERATAVKDRQVAEAALKRAGDAFELERERADSAALDLDSARQERDAANHVSIELSAALEQEREKTVSMAGFLSAARKAIDLVKAQSERAARTERAPKASAAASPLASSGGKHARQTGLQHNLKVQKSSPDLVATITLPDALLPTPRPLNPR
ncbi:hypothetical protein [Mesorhizobium cantuariense]|uniref:Uncharacterized protein n=1 Tax=Mesorhizobium cantuariense TaxID=1300275 RepID=A0ABV7MLI3_9HYPH